MAIIQTIINTESRKHDYNLSNPPTSLVEESWALDLERMMSGKEKMILVVMAEQAWTWGRTVGSSG